jgi:hypothetical protein
MGNNPVDQEVPWNTTVLVLVSLELGRTAIIHAEKFNTLQGQGSGRYSNGQRALMLTSSRAVTAHVHVRSYGATLQYTPASYNWSTTRSDGRKTKTGYNHF